MQEALLKLTNGLYVIAANSCGGWSGSLVDAVSQISINPYQIMISCTNNSFTKECISEHRELSLSILPQCVNPSVIALFGYQSSRETDKWSKADKEIINGLPYLKDSLAKIRAKVVKELVYPCNTIFIAEVTEAFDVRDGEPLTYKYYRDNYKGKDLTNWQTDCSLVYQTVKHIENPSPKQTKQWVCTVCGYVYDGEIPFEELPDDWRCPLCGVGKELFVLQ